MSFIKQTPQEIAAMSEPEFLKYQEARSSEEDRLTKQVNMLEKAVKSQGVAIAKGDLNTIYSTMENKSAVARLMHIDKAEFKSAVSNLEEGQIKTVKVMTSTNLSTGLLYSPTEAGIVMEQQPNLVVQSLLAWKSFGTEQYKWLESTDTKNGEMVDGCAVPGAESSIDFVVKNQKAGKVKAIARICEDFIDDFEPAYNESRKLLIRAVEQTLENQLINGDNTGVNLQSLNTISTEFDGTNVLYAGKIANANLFDVIASAGAEIGKGSGNNTLTDKGFKADSCLVSSIDWLLLAQSLKDANGNYLNYRTVYEGANASINIGGITVYPSTFVTQNTCYVFQKDKARIIYNPKSDKGIQVGYSGDAGVGFDNDILSMKYYLRCNLNVADNDKPAFFKVSDITTTINNLKSA